MDRFAVTGLLFLFALVLLGCTGIRPPAEGTDIPRFSSGAELIEAFKESRNYGRSFGAMKQAIAPTAMDAGAKAGSEADSGAGDSGTRYSETNIQVEGVDEADIMKTDGKYIYTLSSQKLAIAEAYPAVASKVLSITELGEVHPSEIFIHKNTLLVFGSTYREYGMPLPMPLAEETKGSGGAVEEIVTSAGEAVAPQAGTTTGTISEKIMPVMPPEYRPSINLTAVQLWDISDKKNPELKRTVELEGNYVSSRKIGGNVYFVVNAYPHYWLLQEVIEKPVASEEDCAGLVPLYRELEEGEEDEDVELKPIARCTEIGYIEPVVAESFVTIASVSMEDLGREIRKETVVGSGQNVYASQENLYLAQYQHTFGVRPLIEEIAPAPREARQETVIHKFSLDNGNIGYTGKMSAPGTVLNQFSMDEFEENFRIATTSRDFTGVGGSTSNNVYIFGENMEMRGKIEGLAPGESIYSARFMGEKGYLVTFKKVDPLFVIDLSDPYNPRVLGKLKIPGYSDYLHPFDETHLIGVGKDSIPAKEGDFAWYQGVKIALFDVSDVENPKELWVEVIGDRGTESYALHDHKAFLFDKETGLLVLPIQLAEIPEDQKTLDNWGRPLYGDYVFQGAYVYNLSLENGFEFRGRITHIEDNDSFLKSGWYYYGGGYEVQRSLFIGNILYTVSNNRILLNSLTDLAELKELVLAEGQEPPYPKILE